MGRNLTYPKTVGTTINRYKTRGTYDIKSIHEIVNKCSVLHVSFMPSPQDPFPATLPMIGQLGSFEYPSSSLEDPLDLYLHGYISSRLINNARPDAGHDGFPLTVAATIVDGLVLALTPNSHSYNYRSAVLQGYATVVTEDEEKLYAMRLITNKVMPDRWENTRVPPDKTEMTSTAILRVRVVAGSGKIRTGTPHDDAKDSEDSNIANSVWTGVVPVWEQLGEPILAGSGKVELVPEYLKAAVEERSREAEEYAKSIVNER